MKAQFSLSVAKGLWEAITTDPDAFLVASSGVLLSYKRTRGLGTALGLYVTIRRVDQIAAHFAQLKGKELELLQHPPAPIPRPSFNPPA